MLPNKNNEITSISAGTRAQAIVSLLGERFTNKGSLFQPSIRFYDGLSGKTGLIRATNELFRWLGYKPYTLHVNYDDPSSANYAQPDSILIPAAYRNNPYMTGAYLGMNILAHILHKQHKDLDIDQALVEEGTVAYGFGILILNGLKPNISLQQRLYHHIHHDWHTANGIELTTYSALRYGQLVSDYVHNNSLSTEAYWPYTNPDMSYALKCKRSDNILQLQARPYALLESQNQARHWWLRLGVMAVAISLPITFGLYTYSQRPLGIDPATLKSYQRAMELRSAYDDCARKASETRSQTSDDIFSERHLEAQLSECSSLRNQYNYATNEYNQLITQ